MQFLKDLFNWFRHGDADEAVKPAEKAPVVTDKKTAQQPVKEKMTGNFIEEIIQEGRGETFLQELKSILPVSKQFDKDRDELAQEVKRLSRARKQA